MTKARDLANAGTALTSVSATELGYLDGVTSAVQTQLNQKPEFTAGKNKIINGDFGIWQRGTTLTDPAGSVYLADRWRTNFGGILPTSRSYTQQSFTAGTAPVAGYEGTFFARITVTTKGSNVRAGLGQPIEDVRTFAGQTITASFWAKSDSNRTGAVQLQQNFGTGGSTTVEQESSINLTSSWQRFTRTFTLGSVSGKTIGPVNTLILNIFCNSADGSTFDIWGVQLEAGSVATPFTTASGNPNLEIATSGVVGQDGILFSSIPSSVVAGSGTNSWAGYQVAGKNKVINGDFGIWQRGTSFTNPTNYTYNCDRWIANFDGTGATRVLSRQTFTPGTAPVSGYEGTYFYRWDQTVAGSGGTYSQLQQKIEDVRTFAGQTVTFSFWLKTSTAIEVSAALQQEFGTGGSSAVYSIGTKSFNATTSWQRFSLTASVPSISGKTIGTGSSFTVAIGLPNNTVVTTDIWGVQLEAGSVATPFQTATGTVQGELAACQRYYWRAGGDSAYQVFGIGSSYNTTESVIVIPFPVPMRATPTVIDYNALGIKGNPSWTPVAVTSANNFNGNSGSKYAMNLYTLSSSLTSGNYYTLVANNSTSAYLGFGAEL